MTADYVTTRSEQVGFFFRWATWRYYTVPQFFIQAWWLAEIERRAGITFKRAWKGEVSTKELVAEAKTKNSSVEQEIHQEDGTTTPGTLIQGKVDVPPPAVTSLPSVVTASA